MKKSLFGISLLTITSLYFLLAIIIILVTLFTGIPIIYGIAFSILLLIIQFLISPFITDLTMRWFYGVKFKYELPEYLKQFIEEICKNNNMKMPRIGFIDDGAPNAFTYGHTKNDARIIITRGILELLNEEEVKSVVGHELGHATHYDMLVMTAAQIVPLVLYGIYEVLSDNDNDNSKSQLVAMIAYVLYVISNYLVLALSRNREYYADSFSIEATKNPNALASALVKIGYGLTTSETNKKHSAAKSNALGIFDSKTSKTLVITSSDNGEISKDNIKQAMKWEKWNPWAIWYEIHSTHPLISKRLLAISSRSNEFNQEPYIVFDLKKEESYIDDFLIEVLINFLPSIVLIIGSIMVSLSYIYEFNIIFAGGILLLLLDIASYIKFRRRFCKKSFNSTNVRNLLSEVKVSGITSIPCSLEGEIIGRGDPGCIFNEDFVIKDETGIIFLDYNQPIHLANKLFAIFKSKDFIDKKVKITGWYRRSPVPYVELLKIEADGKVKKLYNYGFHWAMHVFMLIISLIVMIFSLL